MGSFRSTTARTLQAYLSSSEIYINEWHRRPYRTPSHLTAWMENLSPRSRILDLGCGPGQDSRYLRRLGFRVVGLDFTEPFLYVARRRSRKLLLVQADIEHLPFPNQTFDGIWSAASLIHIPKSRFLRVLHRLYDITKPGGYLGATLIHGFESGYLPDQWIRGRFLSKWYKHELKRIVEKAGWEMQFLKTVVNQERKGRWLNLCAKRQTT